MKKTITLLLMLILFGAGAYLVYDLSSDKGGTKYVTFAYNDGVNNDYKCKIKDYKINCIVTEPVNGKDEFVGWYDEENNVIDIEGDFNESVTLYPKFLTAQVVTEERKAERKHLITFNMNGGTGSIEKIEVKYEEQLYRLNSLPTKDGYIFLGFYDNKDYKKGKQYYDENGESVRCFDKAGNTTLYAGWEKKSSTSSDDKNPVEDNKKYTITFNANGGSGGQSSSKEVTYGESLPGINMTVPTRNGYKFMGWYDNSDYTKGIQYYNEKCISVIKYDKQKNIILYAGWEKKSSTSSDDKNPVEDNKKYTITFNTNGGSGSMTTQTVTSNVQTVIKTNSFTRTGYAFNGWNTKLDGSGRNYSNGGSIKITSNITLYAQWKVNTYNIEYVLNGGTIGSSAPKIVKYNEMVTISVPTKKYIITIDNNGTSSDLSNNSVIVNQTFAGWTYSNGNNLTAKYRKTGTSTDIAWSDGNVKVVADKFKNLRSENGTVKLIANFNNKEIQLPKVTKSGYVCGYSTTSTSTTITYLSEGKYVPVGNTKLYVICSKNVPQTNTISFNANGGSGKMSSQTVVYNTLTPLIANTFTKSGYIFNGWNTKSDGSGSNYSNRENIKITSNIILYAQWSPCGAGTYSNGSVCSACAKGYYSTGSSNASCVACPKGYTTNGTGSKTKTSCYITCSENTRVTTIDGQCSGKCNTGSIISSHTVYSGKTSPACSTKSYTITFNANDGSENKFSQTIVYNTPTPLKSNTFTRTGYIFNGWNTKSDGSGKSYNNGQNITLTSNITLYAMWKQNAVKPTTCTITFNANDGSENKLSQTVVYNTPTPLKSNTFTRTGYIFNGWNTKSDGSGKSYNNGENITLTSNITLYAKWKANTYIVSFNLNGGTGTTPENKTVTFGKAMPKITTAAPSRSGYEFMGWYDNNNYLNGNALKYYDSTGNSARQYDKTSNVTLYAGWAKIETQPNKYTITFNGNGGSGGQSGSTKDVTYGGSLPSISKTAPTKTGYIFAGWFDSNNYTNGIKYYDANGNAARQKYDVVKSNVTLYAGWMDQNTFIVKYDCGGGKGVPQEQYATNGKLFVPRVNTCKKTETVNDKVVNYVFDGWYDKSGVDWTLKTLSKMNLQNGKNGVSNNTLVLTARWYEELADKSDAKDAIKPTTMITPKNNTESIKYVGKCSDLKADDRHIGLKSNQYCSYESETLKYYIAYNHSSRTGQYNITYVWVKDPYNQLKVAIAEPDPYPTQEKKDNNKWNTLILKEQMGREIIDHEIKTNGYADRGLIGVNASAMISVDWAKSAPVGWRGQPQLNIFRNKSKTIRVSGNSFLANFQIGLAKDGHLKSYDPYVSTSEYNTGERNKLIREYIEKVDEIQDIFGFRPILVKKGVDQGALGDDKLDNRGNLGWNSAATRQAICQVDKNNFIIITSTKYNDTSTKYIKEDDKGPGLTLKDLSYMMTKMHCYMGYNLDGGGSTSYFYKSNKNDLKGPLVAHGSYHGDNRISADILYFVEK